ncbi:MAG: CPBP family intramembrane metalloprotease [Eubacteriaceae bacterium]|nr:CPBP family intramembrane metalloprotease [Eubacteriaceae bacterium]
MKKESKAGFFAEVLILTASLQFLRHISVVSLTPLFGGGDFAARMGNMVVMAALAGATALYARLRNIPLKFFPVKFTKSYIIYTIIFSALLICAPINYIGGIRAIMLQIYGSIITPLFEEILFRGYIWERSQKAFSSGKAVYSVNIALFTLWHLGYMTTQSASGNTMAVLTKLAAGAGYGAVLGFIRLKKGCCYPAFLTHGLLNLFMI